jgi:hypothetical protein
VRHLHLRNLGSCRSSVFALPRIQRGVVAFAWDPAVLPKFLGKYQCTRAFEWDSHFLALGFVRGAYESGGIWSGSGPNNTGHTLWAYATVDGSG